MAASRYGLNFFWSKLPVTFGTFIGAASKQYKACRPSVMASKSFSAQKDNPPPPPSSNILDWHSTENLEINQNHVTHQSADSTINAYFVARRIDVVRLFQKEYGSEAYSLHRDSVIVTIDNLKDKNPGYAVFFEYGAVVFFRLDNAEQVRCLQAARPFCSSLVQLPRSEDMLLKEDTDLSLTHTLNRDKLVLRRLEPETIKVVAGVLGQSVALDYHEREVDSLLEMFRSLNANIQSTGDFNVSKRELYRLVATNNTILTDVITKLKVMDRARPGESAWNVPAHYAIWEGLRDEFEIRTRFNNMESKLELIRENMKFFVEVLSDKKGHRLEVIIIVLIALEIGVALYEHVDWEKISGGLF